MCVCQLVQPNCQLSVCQLVQLVQWIFNIFLFVSSHFVASSLVTAIIPSIPSAHSTTKHATISTTFKCSHKSYRSTLTTTFIATIKTTNTTTYCSTNNVSIGSTFTTADRSTIKTTDRTTNVTTYRAAISTAFSSTYYASFWSTITSTY